MKARVAGLGLSSGRAPMLKPPPHVSQGAVYTFLGSGHPLAVFMADRSREIEEVMARSGSDLLPVGVDLKISSGADGTWVPQRLVRQFSDARGGAILIWSRKTGDAKFWRFPEDPYLPGLAAWWRDPRDAAGSALTAIEVLRYVPTRRVTLAATRTIEGRTERIIVKFKRRTKFDHSSAMLAAVHDAARAQDPRLRIARPLGDLPESSAFCQSFLEGAPFDGEISDERLDVMMKEAGAIHARLHALSVTGVPAWSRQNYIDTIDEDVSWVSYMLPDCQETLRRAWLRLRVAVECADGAREVFCHGDFVPGQMLCEGGATAVTDLDMVRTGLDLQEIAKWIASLKYHVPLIARTLAVDAALGEAMIHRAKMSYLEGYCEQSGQRISDAALRPFIAAAEIHYLGVRLKKDLFCKACLDAALRAMA